MSTSVATFSSSDLLFGKVRGAVLGLIYSRPEESFFMRQIIRMTALSPGAVKRELDQLAAAGLVMREERGKQVFFQANARSPIFDEMRSILLKTFGAGELIRAALEPLAARIRFAFIYGSLARGRTRRGSDIDVMVVGDVRFAEVCDALYPVQARLSRELNALVYPEAEFQSKLSAGHHFLREVMASPKVLIVGDAGEFERLG
jgi:predicted nucleotidyltransferase